jgi:hypothetical protein
LSQDFRRHLAAPPEVPQRTAPYDLWHVAIQDVPVGPMTRDELGRKIDAGAVSADSLCWREGMDDWRPLGELPELAALLRRPRGAQASQRPPRPPRTPPVVPAPPRASMFPATELEEIDEEGSEPTRIADVTSGQPVMSPHVTPMAPAAASGAPRVPTAQGSAPLAVGAAVAAPGAIPGEGSVAVPIPRREGMSGPTGIALGLVAGILIVGGPALYRTFWTSAPPAQPAPQAAIAPPVVEEKPKTTEVVPEPVEPEVQEEAPTKRGPRNKDSKSTVAPPRDNGKTLTDEQKKLLARMGGGDGPALRETQPLDPGGSRGGGGPTLTASQLTGVVQNNKMQLQRCYESALRAAGGKQDGAIKITVKVVVGESGLVKSVSTQGSGLGNMTECMKSSVKRWRFPQSGGESEFEFPLVFQPGA